MSHLIVHGGKVVCGVSEENEAQIIADGAIEIKDGRIARIGTLAELTGAGNSAQVVGGPGFVVFPGFVNAHHHVGLTPLQLGSPDLPLELWVNRRIGGKSVPLYVDTLYSAFEMIRSGVTTVQHLQGRIPGPIANIYEQSHEVLRAYKDIGLRASYSFGVRDQNRIVYEDDERFLARLPRELAVRMRSYVATQTLPLDDNLDMFKRLYSDVEGISTLAVQLAPVNLHWCSDDALARVRDLSESYGAPMHMHLLETQYQEAYGGSRSRGKSAVEHIRALGLLNERMTLGHGVWMTERDLDLVQRSGAHICHNCSSNMRLRSGRAPVNAMLRRGIGVALGIDEAGLNDDRDMLQEMRLVLHSSRVPGFDEDDVPSPVEVFRMASEFGARTTPFNAEIGRLEQGKAADMVLLDWSQVSHPYLDPSLEIIDALVQRAKCRGVHTVLVNGEIVLREGEFTRVDEKAILDEIADNLDRPASEEEAASRQMAQDLIPHIERFYDGYCSQQGVNRKKCT